MTGLRSAAAALLAGCLAGAAHAETVVLEAVERGTFRDDGSYLLGAETGYATGRVAQGEQRSVFVFDTSALEGSARAATLRLGQSSDGHASPDRFERIEVHAVSADPARLAWHPRTRSLQLAPQPALGTFWDLGSGARLGTARVAAGADLVELPLDAAALRLLDRSSGLVAFGVRVDSLRRPKRGAPPVEELVFAGPGGAPPPELVVETDASGAPGPATTLHVGPGPRRRPGSGSEADPFRSIAAALDLATAGDTVVVAPGVYRDGLLMKDGVDVLGAGSDRTIVDLGSSLPSVRCADATLEGFLIRRMTDLRGPFWEAVDCTNGASPRLSENAIVGSFALRLEGSHAIVHGNQFFGTLEGIDSSPILTENELGAVSLSFDTPGAAAPFRIERNRIRSTLHLDGEAPPDNRIVGNLFSGISSRGLPRAWIGGILVSAVGDVGLIASNTFLWTEGIRFCDASPPGPFSGTFCETRDLGGSATIANNILAFGSAGISVDASSSATIVHNDVFGNRDFPFGTGGNYVGIPDPTGVDGNLSEDPLFEGDPEDDAVLGAGSPALDAGTNELVASEVDLHGNPRIVDATGLGEAFVDIGATERQGALPSRRVRVSVETKARRTAFGVGDLLLPAPSFRIAILSDEDFDAPAETDVGQLTIVRWVPWVIGGAARCRARDVDGDGDEDLSCRFPFARLDFLPRQVSKRVCLFGRTRGGEPFSGCDRVHVLHVPRATVR